MKKEKKYVIFSEETNQYVERFNGAFDVIFTNDVNNAKTFDKDAKGLAEHVNHINEINNKPFDFASVPLTPNLK